MIRRRFSIAAMLAVIILFSALAGAPATADTGPFTAVDVCIGANIGPHVKSRVVELLGMVVADVRSHDGKSGVLSMPADGGPHLKLSLGNCPWGRTVITDLELSAMKSEEFRIVSEVDPVTGNYAIFCNGQRLIHGYTADAIGSTVSYGAIAGAYAVLELLGFKFLHPLAPTVPSSLSLIGGPTVPINIKEGPYWPIRIFHHHTQHPLELTEVMQGLDIPMFGPHGPGCAKGNYRDYNQRRGEGARESADGVYCERWEDMVKDMNFMYEWAIANKYNRVEWLLLGNYKWKGFDYSDTRRKRMRTLTHLGNQYGLLVGADVPLGNVQQHGWYMVNPRLPFHEQVQQIRKRVDWVFAAGFDFMTTESGLSEFTFPDCSLMRDLLEEFSTYVNVTWGREALVKVHCSPGQTCADYLDPRTGEPVNFNQLPMFVDGSLGVMPHTVQAYSLDDPVANAYGNANFKEIEDYMYYEAALGNRSVVYYGETAYWVNVDIDVPLFLPIYGQRRLYDLRRIARTEKRSGHRINGQMVFDSGWEWGYWLNAVVAARAAWDPLLGVVDEMEAYAQSLKPIAAIFPNQISERFISLMVRLVRKQGDLLIHGKVMGRPSQDINKLSGMPYLSGSDTWVDLPRLVGLVLTQPDRIRMFEADNENWRFVLPLLKEMEQTFSNFYDDILDLYDDFLAVEEMCKLEKSNAPSDILSEFRDSLHLLALRARQVLVLYQASAPQTTYDQKALLLTESRKSISEAQLVVQRREKKYRVPVDRIAAWRENPTVYGFSYLWSVHSLFYWWRDQGLAEQGSVQSHYSPCYLNRMDASEVAVGWGKYTLEVLRSIIHYFSPDSSRNPVEIVNCITAPSKEYEFPRDLYIY